jgi:hypothetical protein
MEILGQLSSRQGDRTEKSNRTVAGQCIGDPGLLREIANGFDDKDKKLQSDCIEVFTMVSEGHPELIVPYAESILPLLSSKVTKTRWEAAHTLSFIATEAPDIVFSVLPELQDLIEKDKSTIVRDYTVDAIANAAKSGNDVSKAFDVLKSALGLWDGKHAKQVIKGFNNILDNQPAYQAEIGEIVRPYLEASKKVVANEAKKVMKRIKN